MRRYPLSTLERARREAVEGGERALGERTRARQGAEALRNAAAASRAAHADEVRAVVQGERELLAAGGLSVADLARGAAHAEGAALRDRAHRERVEAAAAAERVAAGAEDAARQHLLQARAAERVVERHREAWMADEQARLERAVEEDVAEAWAGGRGRERG